MRSRYFKSSLGAASIVRSLYDMLANIGCCFIAWNHKSISKKPVLVWRNFSVIDSKEAARILILRLATCKRLILRVKYVYTYSLVFTRTIVGNLTCDHDVFFPRVRILVGLDRRNLLPVCWRENE